MNQYGEIVDKEVGVDTEDDEALTIYKNMVKCGWIANNFVAIANHW